MTSYYIVTTKDCQARSLRRSHQLPARKNTRETVMPTAMGCSPSGLTPAAIAAQ